MELYLHPIQLKLASPFTISRGTLTQQESLVVELRDQGTSGWGEVTANRFYQRSLDQLIHTIEKARPMLSRYAEAEPEVVWAEAMELLGDPFAVSALDIAAHDWRARIDGKQIWQRLGLSWQEVPPSSFTIAIDSVDTMLEKLRQRSDWPVFKIKLGTDQDLEIMRQIRASTGARLRVDANCAWSAEQTIELSHALAELDVDFIEQPLPADASLHQQREVFLKSRLPIIADESCRIESDVAKCQEVFHGINVKVCKCGGLTPALRMLRQARELGMKTMVGCMIESSIGISAAAQLLPLLDFADLDGAALLESDPTVGAQLDRGTLILSGNTGHGAYLPITRCGIHGVESRYRKSTS